LTRAYRRRRYEGAKERRYGGGMSWEEDAAIEGYSEPGVDWGGDEDEWEPEYPGSGGYGKAPYGDRYDDQYDYGYNGYDDYSDQYGQGGYEDDYPDYEERMWGRPAPVSFEPFYPEEGDFYTSEGHEEDFQRRPVQDKKGYLEYSEQYRPLTQMDYLSPDAILPGQKYRKKTAGTPKDELYKEYAPRDGWRDANRSGALPGIYKILNIFYEPFILRSFGMKLPLMQLVATLALLELYNITFGLGESAHDALIYISSGWIEYLPPFLASLFALILGILLSLYPALRREPKRMLKRVLLIIILVIIFLNPLLNLIIFSGWGNVARSFLVMVIFLGKIVLIFIYLSPVILGVFAIWGRKGEETLTVLSVVLLLLVVVTSNVIDIYMEDISKVDSGSMSLYFIYAILLFLYIEATDSSYKYYRFAIDVPDDPENRDQVYFFNKALNVYYLYLFMLILIGVFLTLVVFNRSVFLGSLGSERLAESLEVSTDFGMLISMVVLFSFLGILLVMWKNRTMLTSPVKRLYRTYIGYRQRERELLEMEEEVRRLKLMKRHLD